MPTPRFTGQIAQQAGRSAPVGGGASQANDWVGGIVVAVTGFINSQYQVYLDTCDYVFASSTIESPIAEGDLVWVTRGGGTPLIVAVQ